VLNRRAAFSIVETVVVIAILVIIVALLTPAIARVRAYSRSTVSLSNLRQHGLVTRSYVGDWEVFPFVTEAREGYTRLEGGGVSRDSEFFGAYAAWPIALLDDYYEGSAYSEVFHPPGGGAGPISSYWYSANFISDPAFWDQKQRMYSLKQLRPVSAHEVLWPSAKGVFAERDSLLSMRREWDQGGAGAFAMVDGSAELVQSGRTQPAYPNGCGGFLGGLSFGVPVIHTREGVRGRDFR
jgi:type II secretory pathway pseudopilin PulG